MPYKDREQQLKAQRDAYHAKKEHYRSLHKNRKIELKRWFWEEILINLKCNRCNEADSACLEFHHKDPLQKDETIGAMIKKMRTKDSILVEIDKCEILCANCHRKHHHAERKIKSVPDTKRQRW